MDYRKEIEERNEDFFFAATTGNLAAVKRLAADRYVNVNWQNHFGATPFHAACQKGNLEVVRYLLGVDRLYHNLALKEGANPFYVACEQGHVDVVALLLSDRRIAVNEANNNGVTPFFIACQTGHEGVVSLLLADPRIGVNQPRDFGTTPFLVACQEGHVEVVLLLLGDGRVDVNKADSDECTPLWMASQHGHLSVVQRILASGREIDATRVSSFNGKTAAEHARAQGARLGKEEWESDEDLRRTKTNCPVIAELIDAFVNDPVAARTQIENELRWLMRRKRERVRSDAKLQVEERNRLLKKVKLTEPANTGVESLQSMTKCTICQDVLKNPKTLACVHSFCLECLEKQTEKVNPPYRCAVCTAPFVIPLGGLRSLKTSPLLADLLSSSAVHPPSSPSASSAMYDPNDVKCDLCEDNEEAAFHCGECDQFLGDRCAITHRKSKSSAHHQLQPIGDYFSGSRGKESAGGISVPRCQKHRILETDVFCKTCGEVCCAKCAVESHGKHDYRPLAEENERLRGDLIELTTTIAVREKEAQKGRKTFIQAPEKLTKGRKTAGEDLQRAFEILREAIDRREAEMVGKLEDRCGEVEKAIEVEKDEIDFALAEFKGYREINEAVLMEGTNVEVATGHSMLTSRGKTLEGIGFLNEPSENPEVKFQSKNLEELRKAISAFGDIK